MGDEYDRGVKAGIKAAAKYVRARRRQRVDEVFEREVRRWGLEIDMLEVNQYEIRSVLTIRGSSYYAALNISGADILAAGPAQTMLLTHEILGVRDRLHLGWHFEQLRKEDPRLVLIMRHERRGAAEGNVITTVHRSEKTFECNGSRGRNKHPLPERCVLARHAGVEVIEPEDE